MSFCSSYKGESASPPAAVIVLASNAIIPAVVEAAILKYGLQVIGIEEAFYGLTRPNP